MTIKADYHLHSSFSGDSDTPMEDMVLQGISQGLSTMCFTEHLDMDYPYQNAEEGLFELNTDSYLYELIRLKVVDYITDSTICEVMKKTKSSRGL